MDPCPAEVKDEPTAAEEQPADHSPEAPAEVKDEPGPTGEQPADPSSEALDGVKDEVAEATGPDVSITLLPLCPLLSVYRPLPTRSRRIPLRKPLKGQMISRLSRLRMRYVLCRCYHIQC